MKYTIELTDTEYNVLTKFMDMISTEIKAEYFQKAKLEPTKKAWEDKLAEAKEFAYNDGFEHGKLWAIKENAENHNTAINDYNAMIQWLHDCTDDFKEFMNKKYGYDIVYLTNPKVDEGVMLYDLICDHDIAEVISEFQKWQEKKKKKKADEIKVGDEVETVGRHKGIILQIYCTGNREWADVLFKDGITGTRTTETLSKTGRHFDEVEHLLNKLRDEE